VTRIPATRDVSLPGGRRPSRSDGRGWSRASAGEARIAAFASPWQRPTDPARRTFSSVAGRDGGRALPSGRRPAAHGKEGR
jgi:hypothetical protein